MSEIKKPQMKSFKDASLPNIDKAFNEWANNTLEPIIILDTQTEYSAALQKFFMVVIWEEYDQPG